MNSPATNRPFISHIGAVCCALVTLAARAEPPLTYEADVRPILRTHCFHCHGDDGEKKSDLDLRLRRLIVLGGKKGPAIVPGNPRESRLLELVKSGEMPDEGKPVPAAEIQVIERWIAAGAPTAGPEPDDAASLNGVNDADRRFWSFQPIRRPGHREVTTARAQVAMPSGDPTRRAANPIDLFLLEKLDERKLTFSPQANKRTLIRRATFGLLGLPPSAEEVAAFEADATPDAYEKLIDRLLDSPHYGERWGRHWLDAAGYADSEGYTTDDPPRASAYLYRDYVVAAFNEDMPWDRFIVEQLAGDELVPPPHQNLTPGQQRLLAATGFLRMAPDGTATYGVDQAQASNAVVAETIKIVSTSLLGLTVGCAQCHTHKYDPIPQVDYYRMRAIFEPAMDWKNWRTPAQRGISLYTDEDRKLVAQIEAEAGKVDAERQAYVDAKITEILERELAKVPQDQRQAVLDTRNAPPEKRTPEQVALAKQYYAIMTLNASSLYLYDPEPILKALKEFTDRAAAIRAPKPVEVFLHALNEIPNQPPPQTFVFHRGDTDQPRAPAPPGVLSVTEPYLSTPIPIDDPDSPFTGRRLAYARHLTSGRHPLVARVLVNRFWMHHFGRGIVATQGDFGARGQPPRNPELLDWLADDFMAHGWSLKRLHKLVMTSAAYRQASGRRPEGEAADPENTLHWRAQVRRLEAEAVRDAMLYVSGQLNAEQRGVPVPVAEDSYGQVIPAMEKTDDTGVSQPIRDLGGQEYRRSLYLQVRRSKPLSLLDTFDMPEMSPNCVARDSSNVAPQSLLLMNNEFVLAAADAFASRLERESGDRPSRVAAAWERALGREPTDAERDGAIAFLTEQEAILAGGLPVPAPPEGATEEQRAKTLGDHEVKLKHLALVSLCHGLLSASEFLYLE